MHGGAGLGEVDPQRLHRALAEGAVAVLHDGRFDPGERLRLCEELGVNVLCQAPTEYRMLAKRGELRPVPRCGGWSRPASRSSRT